jgi:hypothetical protein
VIGTQLGTTQIPARHSIPSAHAPHSSARPQRSPIVPQNVAPGTLQLAMGVQLGPPTQRLSWHVQSPSQAGQVKVPSQPLPISPQ